MSAECDGSTPCIQDHPAPLGVTSTLCLNCSRVNFATMAVPPLRACSCPEKGGQQTPSIHVLDLLACEFLIGCLRVHKLASNSLPVCACAVFCCRFVQVSCPSSAEGLQAAGVLEADSLLLGPEEGVRANSPEADAQVRKCPCTSTA
jgi:hypothetical protein